MGPTTAGGELFSYILPGKIADARAGLTQAQDAEAIGLGGIFLSERWETKELGSVMGALSQATQKITLVAGLTHFGTRHPLVLAGLASTMQSLSNNRFVLGFGRGVPTQFRKLGIPVFNNAAMADYASLLRRLWAGETISYSGPVGEFPEMQLGQICMNPPPLIIGAIGPKTLALAGAHFDGVVLHPFLTTQGVARSIQIVREAAEKAGRSTDAVKIYATVIVAPDTLNEEERSDILEARAVSYFVHEEIGRSIAAINGWDEAPMLQLAASKLGHLEYAQGDIGEARRQMANAADIIPGEWLTSGSAVGSVDACTSRLREYMAVGVDKILMHGTVPDQQRQILSAMNALPTGK